MPDLNNLMGRIDAEFSAAEQKIKNLKTQQVETFKEREKRLEKFVKLSEDLRDIWRPRLEALA